MGFDDGADRIAALLEKRGGNASQVVTDLMERLPA